METECMHVGRHEVGMNRFRGKTDRKKGWEKLMTPTPLKAIASVFPNLYIKNPVVTALALVESLGIFMLLMFVLRLTSIVKGKDGGGH
ncbi:hypothetical protein GE21DRAFT_1103664 [Neurospora crassa]|nr:hypothetical protein GE21DRAFT_1103664 [Neurospora crassa]